MASVKKSRKRKLGSYPSFSVVASMFLALFVLGLFALFLLLSKNLSTAIQESIQVQVYLEKDISESQRIQIEKTLSSSEFVLQKERSVVLITKDSAAEKFIAETGEDFYEFLGDNPLRDVYIVNIAPDYQTDEKMAIVQKEVESISGVYEMDYVKNMLSSINTNITKISLALIGFAIILLIAVIVLINNTIKLALFSQRFLIRSMQLVGAKAGFIRKPFLYRAFFHGMLAGAIASVFLYSIINYGMSIIPGIDILLNIEIIAILFGSLLCVGAIVGFFGTFMAIRKYLKMSLDELY
ncbi:MAG: permease-like cell division protein FtsX [Cyclobacteriaceae bacterium]|nr:permease-like cell division protein FtsX [Cyclobacteriaceae bacterium]